MTTQNSSIQKLVIHTRKITKELLKQAFAFSEDDRSSAQSKFDYAKKVKESLEKQVNTDINEEIDGEDAFIVILASVLPQLERAINEMEEVLMEEQKVEPGEHVPTEEELEEMLLQNFKRVEEERKLNSK